MRFGNAVTRILKGGLLITAFFVLFIIYLFHSPAKQFWPVRVYAQTVFELSCPLGTSSIQSLQTTDNINGQIRQNACVDFSGHLILTSITIGGSLNNCFSTSSTIDIQSAINAAPAGGMVCVAPGTYTPSSTINITKSLTVEGGSSASTFIVPTSAVTGSVININPSSAAQIIIRRLNLNLVNVPTINAINANNLAAESEIGWIVADRGAIGLNISNSGVDKFHDLRMTNQTINGINDNADGGAEHHFYDVWLINNNAAVNTSVLFNYTRTTATDVGGLYLNRIWAIQNGLGGIVTNAMNLSASGSQANVFGSFQDVTVDGITGGDSVIINNLRRIVITNGQYTNAKANQSCAAATINCFSAFNLINTSQVSFSPTAIIASNNRDISFSNTVDRTTIMGTHLFGSAAAGAAHLWIVTGAALSNTTINSPDYDSTTTYSNNEAALIASSPKQMYSQGGSVGVTDGVSATPSIFLNSDRGLGFFKSAANQLAFTTTPSGVTNKFDNTGHTSLQYFTLSNCSSSASPAVCGNASSGSVAIPAAATTLTVNTSAVTANSQIILSNDNSLGTKLSVTCNTTVNSIFVSARVNATSFTITVSAAPVTNPQCLSYSIIN